MAEDLRRAAMLELARREQARRKAKREKALKKGEEVREDIVSRGEKFVESLPEVVPEIIEDATRGAIRGATFGASDELGISKKEDIIKSRERSPVAFTAGEIGGSLLGGAPLTGASKLLRGLRTASGERTFGIKAAEAVGQAIRPGAIRRTALESGAFGYLGSEGKTTEEKIKAGIVSAALGSAVHGTGRVVKRFFKDPSAKRASALGASQRDFRFKDEYRSIEEAADSLHKADAFAKEPMLWDPRKRKYIKSMDGVPRDEKFIERSLAERFEDTKARIHSEVMDTLAGSAARNKKYTSIDVMTTKVGADKKSIQDVLDDATNVYGSDAIALANKEQEELVRTIDNMLLRQGKTELDIFGVYQLKKMIQDKVQQMGGYSNPFLEATDKQRVKLLNDMARKIRQLVEHEAGPSAGSAIKNMNKDSAHHYRLLETLEAQEIAKKTHTGQLPQYAGAMNQVYQAARGAGEMIKTPGAGLSMAGFAESMGQIPIPLRKGAEDVIQKAPGIMFTDRYMKDRNLGREPQSLPEALMETPFPRSSEAVMEKPNLFLAKVAQQTDNHDLVVQLQEAMKHPRKLEKIMPLIARQYPHLFEYSEYGDWDGKLIDPADRQIYTKDIRDRTDLNEYQKAEIIDHLNKTNEMLL